MESPEESRSPSRALWFGFALLLTACFLARVSFIERTLPYSMHIDEASIGKSAARMIRNGDAHPHYFRYPTLPIYLTTGSFLLGRVLDGDTESEVGSPEWPFYDRPAVVGTARVLFALLSIGAMAFATLAGARALREPLLLVLSPLILALSGVYLTQSWVYLNVDIVGAFVCTLAVWVMLRFRERDSLFHRALLPGLLTGLAVGSKFYLGLVGLPFAMLLFEQRFRPQLLRNLAVITAMTVLGFLLSTPYAVLDHEAFWSGLMSEVEHYGKSNPGRDRAGAAGLPQLIHYFEVLRSEFGLGLLTFAALGLGVGLARLRRETLLLVAFPLALFAFLCTQRVNYPRNLTTILALLPAFAGFGLVVAARALAERSSALLGKNASVVSSLSVATLCLTLLPWKTTADAYSIPTDSRTRLTSWINAQVRPETRLYIARELLIDLRQVDRKFDITVAPLEKLLAPDMSDAYAGQDALFVVPTYERGTRLAATFAKLLKPVNSMRELERWGRIAVRLDRDKNIHLGDPSLAVYEIAE